MNLYEINEAINEVINSLLFEVNEETGEVSDELTAKLEELKLQKEEKIDNIGAYIKNLSAEAKMLKDEEKALKERREAKERKAEHLKNYLASVLNGEKFESPRVACSWRKSEAVAISNVELLPEEFTVTKTEISADKTKIKEALKSGQEVTGAWLETRNNLQIK